MTKGILLIAAGHPFYGNSAFHLALTIKKADPDAVICLAFQQSAIAHLNEKELTFFDQKIELKHEHLTSKGKTDYMKPKLHAYELSPFDRTILLDVDMIWNPKKTISDLFESLKSTKFTMISEGWCDAVGDGPLNPRYTFWADRELIVHEFMNVPGFLTGRIYQLRSEFIYFEKGEKVANFFETAISVREQINFEVKTLGGNIPDELCFDIAGAITHTYPHQEKWTPIHWYWFHGRPHENVKGTILSEYYAISLGGFNAPKEVLNWTKAMLRNAAEAQGVTIRHSFGPKTTVVPGRKSF